MDNHVADIYKAVLIDNLAVRIVSEDQNEFIVFSFWTRKGALSVIDNILQKAGPDVAAQSLDNLKIDEYILSPKEEK